MKRLIAAILISTLTTSPAYALRPEGPQGGEREALERALGGLEEDGFSRREFIKRAATLQRMLFVVFGIVNGGLAGQVLAMRRNDKHPAPDLGWKPPEGQVRVILAERLAEADRWLGRGAPLILTAGQRPVAYPVVVSERTSFSGAAASPAPYDLVGIEFERGPVDPLKDVLELEVTVTVRGPSGQPAARQQDKVLFPRERQSPWRIFLRLQSPWDTAVNPWHEMTLTVAVDPPVEVSLVKAVAYETPGFARAQAVVSGDRHQRSTRTRTYMAVGAATGAVVGAAAQYVWDRPGQRTAVAGMRRAVSRAITIAANAEQVEAEAQRLVLAALGVASARAQRETLEFLAQSHPPSEIAAFLKQLVVHDDPREHLFPDQMPVEVRLAVLFESDLLRRLQRALADERGRGAGLEELEHTLNPMTSRRDFLRRAKWWAVGTLLGGGAGAGLWAGTDQLTRIQALNALRELRQSLQALPQGFPGSASAEIIGPQPITSPGQPTATAYWVSLTDSAGRLAKAAYQYVVLDLEHTRPSTLIISLRAVTGAGPDALEDVVSRTLTLDRGQLDALSFQKTPYGPLRALIALALDQPPLSAQPFRHLVVGIQTDPPTTSAVPLTGVAYAHDALWHYEPEQAGLITSLAGMLASSTSSAALPVISGGVLGAIAGEAWSHAEVRELVRDGLQRLQQTSPAAPRAGLEENPQSETEILEIPRPPRTLATILRSVSFTKRNSEMSRKSVIVGPGAVGILPVLALVDRTWDFRIIPRDAEQAQQVRDWMRQQELNPNWVLEPPETFARKAYLKAVRDAQESLLGGEHVAASAVLVQGFHDLKIAIPESRQQPVVREVVILPSEGELLELRIRTFLPVAYGCDVQKGIDVLMDEVRRVEHYLLGNL